jgi:hypothetical protein
MRILLFLALMWAGLANAQIGQGRWLLTTSLFGSDRLDQTRPGLSNITSDSRSWSFQITPTIGYFVTDRTAIGTFLSLANSGSSFSRFDGFSVGPQINMSTTGRQSWSLGVFARRYQWLGRKQRFALFGDLGMGYVKTNVQDSRLSDQRNIGGSFSSRNSISESDQINLGVLIGGVYRINNWLGLEVVANLANFSYGIQTDRFQDGFAFGPGPISINEGRSRNASFTGRFSPSAGTSFLTVGAQIYLGRNRSSVGPASPAPQN